LESLIALLVSKLSSEPVAITVILVFLFRNQITIGLNKAWAFITRKERKKTLEEIIREEAAMRGERQKEVDQYFEKIEKELSEIRSTMTAYETARNKHSQGILEALFHDTKRKPKDRLKTFRRLLALRVNGDIKSDGFTLALNNKSDWMEALQEKMEDQVIIDSKYYYDSIEEINRRIFDNGMTPPIGE
jgi:hypothetical protein